MDFILNGQASGSVAQRLMASNFDPGAMRPYVGDDGRSYITINVNGKPTPQLVNNANALLRKDEWIQLDQAIIRAAKPRLRAVADLMSSGLTYTMPNGMGHTVLQHQTVGDMTPAAVSMDGVRRSENDAVEFGLASLPLPIIHKDFEFTLRQLSTSRHGGSPLDTTYAELAGRRVAEEAEKMLLGVSSVADQYAFGGGTIYGYTDFPSRNTKVLTLPTDGAWTGNKLLTEILAMKAQAVADYHYGPYMLYNSPGWDQYLDDDYSLAKGENTLRERIVKIDGINGMRTLDYLSDYQILLVQMTSDVVREVNAMSINTLQWEEQGGLLLKYKVMAIMVPQLRADINGNCGIVHGTGA